jgi:predicted house-cleaning noncanonical NTP pyrophosphatase (MazG superfamily)
MREHNKLVRDGIPGIIERNGERPVYRTLSEIEFRLVALDKLVEETKELCAAKSRSEFLLEAGDVEEIYQAVLAAWRARNVVSLIQNEIGPLGDEPRLELVGRARAVHTIVQVNPSAMPLALKDFHAGFEEWLRMSHLSLEELEFWRKRRFEDKKRGGFDKRIFLIKTYEAHEFPAG